MTVETTEMCQLCGEAYAQVRDMFGVEYCRACYNGGSKMSKALLEYLHKNSNLEKLEDDK